MSLRCLVNSGFIYWLILFDAVAIIDAVIMVFTLKKKKKLSGAIARVIAAAIFTTAAYSGSFSHEDYFTTSVYSSLYFIGIDFILVFMFEFVIRLSENAKKTPFFIIIQTVGGLLVAADIIILLINPFKEIALSYSLNIIDGHSFYTCVPGFLYTCHLYLCYAIIISILVTLVHKSIITPALYRTKYRTVFYVFVINVLLNAIYMIWSDYFILDISVLFYSLSALLTYLAVFKSIPKSLLYSARSHVVENLDQPLLLFDYEDRLIDSNAAAKELFPEMTTQLQTTVYSLDVPEYFRKKGFPELDENLTEFEWQLIEGEENRLFQCKRSDYRDNKGRLVGRLLMLKDISFRKDSATGLEFTPSVFRYLSSLDPASDYPVHILAMNINNLGRINSTRGHDIGDRLMKRLTSAALDIIGKDTFMFKFDSGTIIALLPAGKSSNSTVCGEQLRIAVAEDRAEGFGYEAEYGISELNSPEQDVFTALQLAELSLRNRKLLSDSSHESAVTNSIAQMLLESDYETEAHVLRTKTASYKISRALGLSDLERTSLALLCVLHDIGKICIPKEILLKPAKLSDEEWEVMKSHTDKGYRIAMASAELRGIGETILHHHERWDGNGYPDGLKGSEIPLLSRIVTVLDSFDVMTHDRPYHKAMSIENAKAELIRCSGTQFDPDIVDTFLDLADDIYAS